jgi:hypothetical protein
MSNPVGPKSTLMVNVLEAALGVLVGSSTRPAPILTDRAAPSVGSSTSNVKF